MAQQETNATSRNLIKNQRSSVLESEKKVISESVSNEMKVYTQDIDENTPIQNFYKGQTLFITGGSGFLGKVLIEKLLRCCPSISRIYILIREKKGKSVDERLHDLLSANIFTKIQHNIAKLTEKIVCIQGDISLPQLGLTDANVTLLRNEVSIVFHVGATVRFDEDLEMACATNIRSTANILKLCNGMDNLKSLVNVSTIYSNYATPNIEEKFYDYSLKYEELLDLFNTSPKNIIDSTPQLIRPWPNTYTFTKALAENVVRVNNNSLPMGIFRPGIVISTANEPISGWTSDNNGPAKLLVGYAFGALKVLHGDSKCTLNFVPVDLTINAMIACAWDIALESQRRDENMLIYNFTSTVESPITLGRFCNTVTPLLNQYPLKLIYPRARLIVCKSKFLYTLLAFFLHWLPAYLIYFTNLVIKRQKSRIYFTSIGKLNNLIEPFLFNEWVFDNTNVRNLWKRLDRKDKKIFPFTMKNFDWNLYLDNYAKSLLTYQIKKLSI